VSLRVLTVSLHNLFIVSLRGEIASLKLETFQFLHTANKRTMNKQTMFRFVFLLVVAVVCCESRSFSIDYSNNAFSKDGAPFRLVSGSVHYFRVHPTDWEDRLYKLRYAGFNAVQTYVEWSSHEPSHGTFDFSSPLLNLTAFIRTAQKLDLLVILRPGPYIDAERDMGGLPSWLIGKDPDMALRTADATFLKYLDSWYAELLPRMKPLLYSEGGPIVMVQIENEYGDYYACDFAYTSHLRDVIKRELGDDVILYTTDARRTAALRCGVVPGAYPTIDFGPGYTMDIFKMQRLFAPTGPLMNSEYYPGWLDHWGRPHSTRNISDVTTTLDAMLAVNASVNMYMFHGGTSFGMKAGADFDTSFTPCPTSYDYDAPLSEAGDLTPKYWAVRETIGKYEPLPAMEAPTNSSKAAYGQVAVFLDADVFSSVENNNWNHTQGESPLSFEALGFDQGLVIYKTTVTADTTDPALLSVADVHDRAYIYLDSRFLGVLDRQANITQLPLTATAGQELMFVTESMGRVDFGPLLKDSKGLLGPVKLGPGVSITSWNQTTVDLRVPETPSETINEVEFGAMSWYTGNFNITSEPQDTFLRLDGWSKGMASVNGFMLGRYWPGMGPQVTLYVPHGVLVKGLNYVTLLELQGAPCGAGACAVTFVDTAVIDGPTPAGNQDGEDSF